MNTVSDENRRIKRMCTFHPETVRRMDRIPRSVVPSWSKLLEKLILEHALPSLESGEKTIEQELAQYPAGASK